MEVFNKICITGVAPTIAEVLGIEKPEKAGESINILTTVAKEKFSGGNADRVLMYNPDAIAMYLYQKYTDLYKGVLKNVDVALPMLAVMPSVTPVCFGSMYTGAVPAVHGIQKYEKPVIKIETIFDSIIKAGKKAAIVAHGECSMGKIFLERVMDYYIYKNVEQVNDKVMELINEDKYDLLAVYNGNYDSTMHKNAPESEVSINALKDNIKTFDMLASEVKEKWTQHNTMVAFAPDHGCHEIDDNLGSHGLNTGKDMNIMHFYGFYPKRQRHISI